MKQSDLKNIEHLDIYEEKPSFLHLHTEEGYVLTAYNEGDDIKGYYASVCCYAPYQEEYPDYRTITVAEDEELRRRRDEAINTEMEEKH